MNHAEWASKANLQAVVVGAKKSDPCIFGFISFFFSFFLHNFLSKVFSHDVCYESLIKLLVVWNLPF